MNETILPPPALPVDPTARWFRLVARERRAFRDFCAAASDDLRLEAYSAWIDAHRQMMAERATDETTLNQKLRSFFRLADMQFGEGLPDLSEICADLWRLADLEQRHDNAEDWLGAFECFGGRWTIEPEGIVFFIRIAGSTDADMMMARRLEEQLRAQPELERAVMSMILEGATTEGKN